MKIHSPVTRIPAASSVDALRHFETKLRLETDCWDVQFSMSGGAPDFVLLDVRSQACFHNGHVPGAVHLPHAQITAESLQSYPVDTLFVVYCAGPHCNGADKAAARLAELGRPVKVMIGGITGWLDEGFELDRGGVRTPLRGEI